MTYLNNYDIYLERVTNQGSTERKISENKVEGENARTERGVRNPTAATIYKLMNHHITPYSGTKQ